MQIETKNPAAARVHVLFRNIFKIGVSLKKAKEKDGATAITFKADEINHKGGGLNITQITVYKYKQIKRNEAQAGPYIFKCTHAV